MWLQLEQVETSWASLSVRQCSVRGSLCGLSMTASLGFLSVWWPEGNLTIYMVAQRATYYYFSFCLPRITFYDLSLERYSLSLPPHLIGLKANHKLIHNPKVGNRLHLLMKEFETSTKTCGRGDKRHLWNVQFATQFLSKLDI